MFNMKQIMKQTQAMQQKMADMQSKRALKEFTGTSGGGVVSLVIDGASNMRSLTIDESIINKDEADILSDLIIAAYNDAKKKAEEDSESEYSGVLNGLGLPPGFKMPF